MVVRKVATSITSTVLLGLAMAGLASPSHAETTVTLSGDLTDPGNGDPLLNGTFSPSSVVGPTVVVASSATFNGNPEAFWIDAPGVLTNLSGQECSNATGSCEVNPLSPSIRLAITPSADSASVRLFVVEAGPQVSGGFTVTYSATPGGASSSGVGPAPHIQQFGVPESGICDEAASEDLNWSGVASGGWGESWSQWINEGDGGAVCTRMLVYNTSTSAWEVD